MTTILNANNEPDQLKSLTDLCEIVDCFGDIQNKNIILGGDFNVIFYSFLETQGAPSLNKHTLAKIIQIKEKFNRVVIWRIQNPKTKRSTFRQHHTTCFIQRS